MEEIVPDVYAKAVREHDLDPVERPKFEVVEEAGGRPSRMRATVEVRPEIRWARIRASLYPARPSKSPMKTWSEA